MEEMPYVTREEFQVFKDNQRRLMKSAYGNGDPGWDEILRNILKWMEAQEKKAEYRRLWWDKFQWFIIPLALTGILGLVGQMLYFYVKIVPSLP